MATRLVKTFQRRLLLSMGEEEGRKEGRKEDDMEVCLFSAKLLQLPVRHKSCDDGCCGTNAGHGNCIERVQLCMTESLILPKKGGEKSPLITCT